MKPLCICMFAHVHAVTRKSTLRLKAFLAWGSDSVKSVKSVKSSKFTHLKFVKSSKSTHLKFVKSLTSVHIQHGLS